MPDPHVERLDHMTEAELEEYVRGRLLGYPSEPPVLWSPDDTPERFIADAYALAGHPLKTRLRRGVWNLLDGWNPSLGDDAEYGARVISLAGRLQVVGAEGILVRLADDPAIEGLAVEGEPLVSIVLSALLDFRGQESRPDFWEPRLQDERVFDVAFTAFVLRGPAGAAETLHHLPQYLDTALRVGLEESAVEEDVSLLIGRQLAGNRRRMQELRHIVAGRPPGQRELLERILRDAGARLEDAQPGPPLVLAERFDFSTGQQEHALGPRDLMTARNGAR